MKKIITALFIVILVLVVVFAIFKTDIINYTKSGGDNEAVSSPLSSLEADELHLGEDKIELGDGIVYRKDMTDIQSLSSGLPSTFKTYYDSYYTSSNNAWGYVSTAGKYIQTKSTSFIKSCLSSIELSINTCDRNLDSMKTYIANTYPSTSSTNPDYDSTPIVYNACMTDYGQLLSAYVTIAIEYTRENNPQEIEIEFPTDASVSVKNWSQGLRINNFPSSIMVSNQPSSMQISNFPSSIQVSNLPSSIAVNNFPEGFNVLNWKDNYEVTVTNIPHVIIDEQPYEPLYIAQVPLNRLNSFNNAFNNIINKLQAGEMPAESSITSLHTSITYYKTYITDNIANLNSRQKEFNIQEYNSMLTNYLLLKSYLIQYEEKLTPESIEHAEETSQSIIDIISDNKEESESAMEDTEYNIRQATNKMDDVKNGTVATYLNSSIIKTIILIWLGSVLTGIVLCRS